MRSAWVPDWADDVPESTVEALRETYMPEMPPLEEGSYLVGYLLELGPVHASGMGQGPISHESILAWQALTGIELEPWEARLLRRLSCDYLSESHRAQKLGCEPPWKIEGVKREQTALQQSLRALIEQ
ncbi:MAG: hypothetical protein WC100_02325 [Sterolibacterium sp.]